MKELKFKILEIEATSNYLGNKEEELVVSCGIPHIISEILSEEKETEVKQKSKEIVDLIKQEIQECITKARFLDMLEEDLKKILEGDTKKEQEVDLAKKKTKEIVKERLDKALNGETDKIDEETLIIIRKILDEE